MDQTRDRGGPDGPSLARRAFLTKVAARSLATLGVAAAAGAVLYEKPELRSFSPQTTAYAQTSGAGKFTLKGGS